MEADQASAADPRSGFCRETKTFRSLRPAAALPPESLPLSAAGFAFSLLPSPLPSNPALVDAATGAALSFSELLSRTRSLAAALRSASVGLSPGAVAFVLAPPSFDVPVLYLALLSVGAVVSPANPLSTPAEIAHQIRLCKPSVAFVAAAAASKIPSHVRTLVLDSPSLRSLYTRPPEQEEGEEVVRQSDAAAILYSSGTTGRVKGVVLSHRNFIALIAGYHAARTAALAEAAAVEPPAVALFTIPLFHVFGFFMLLRAAALGETTVLMERFEFGAMLRAVEAYRVTFVPAAPPLLVALAKSEVALRHDLSSLRVIAVGGAPLGREVAELFAARFPDVEIVQGYGLTESAGGGSATMGAEESRRYGSVGRIVANLEAKIVDPTSGQVLGPGEQGELWIRGPTIMKGYICDEQATASTLDSEGWLKTGDLCYFDDDGFLFIVDRLKELIKYKAYQVPPAELERILQSHKEIADAAVIPYPDEEAGQIPMAFIVKQQGSTLTAQQAMDFVAKQLPTQLTHCPSFGL
ncbi:4-coumarate--CoA ligase-like 5 isoform X2 [Ananas comosus]|uniref:4-coumarate--CoA ligase n=1 Tax=Ananas comosus TaxID=4615 RepID=A0A6P5FC02_ANACO|nr:4-coumarate--CoA ligase-like 5 isoform X2 [Ananas comosus]